MISRGYYIGEIVDQFSTIAHQVEMRNKLGFTDLNVIAENYFRDILNAIFGIKLASLNASRSNEPGLDLGDPETKLAIQVTSRSDSKKIFDTLSKLTDEQKNTYTQFVVLVIGQKQGSYTLTDPIYKDFSFDEDSIWDLTYLAREVVALNLLQLEQVHLLVRKETARLLFELELPDADGKFATSDYDNWEQPPKVKASTGAAFVAYLRSNDTEVSPREEAAIAKALAELGEQLSRLPRVTREFLTSLYEKRRADGGGHSAGSRYPNLPLASVQRLYKGNDLQGELDLLMHENLIGLDLSSHDNPIQLIVLHTPGGRSILRDGFFDYVKEKGLSFRKIFGEADLSGF